MVKKVTGDQVNTPMNNANTISFFSRLKMIQIENPFVFDEEDRELEMAIAASKTCFHMQRLSQFQQRNMGSRFGDPGQASSGIKTLKELRY
uniref:Uncharacterized protein n=1 Tax=Arundo donax TaxID=35708 RepID=A0A0A8YI64_ARUDO